MKNITISEYGYIGCKGSVPNNPNFSSCSDLNKTNFTELKKLWEDDPNINKVFSLKNKYCLKANSYVGIIQTEQISLEILPKTYKRSSNDDENNKRINENRTILLEMLKPQLGIKEVVTRRAGVATTKNSNILEVFIGAFIEDVELLIHKGIKSDYLRQEGNLFFLKGKLMFNNHIKHNIVHKERFYVAYDEYLPNRPANRLIKSTIALLLKKTQDTNNKKKLRQQLFIFDQVEFSKNYVSDFAKVKMHRGMEHYRQPLMMAETFLLNETFAPIRDNKNSYSVLFPMETLFEKYMEYVLENSKDNLGIKSVHINGYENDYFLTNDMINLQPDYLLEMQDDKHIVCDAKWKIFDTKEDKPDTNKEKEDGKIASINPGDVYQVFSYLNFYKNVKSTAYIFAPQIDHLDGEYTYSYQRQDDTNKKIIIDNKKITLNLIDLKEIVKTHQIKKSDLNLET